MLSIRHLTLIMHLWPNYPPPPMIPRLLLIGFIFYCCYQQWYFINCIGTYDTFHLYNGCGWCCIVRTRYYFLFNCSACGVNYLINFCIIKPSHPFSQWINAHPHSSSFTGHEFEHLLNSPFVHFLSLILCSNLHDLIYF